jgi:hypothetical protein
MPLDHYVSQVHLRNFYSPALDGKKMHGFRKRDGHIFPCGSKDVCRIQNGSTNEYLLHDRAIEEFLKTIEPNYDRAVAELRTGKPSRDAVYTIAGFIAYVSSCSPTAMRLGADPLRSSVEATAKILDAQGQIPRAPESLGGKTITDLLADGIVNVAIDGKYPQAMGINGVMDRLGIWANCPWDVIVNNDARSPFFTSDFPTAIERSRDPRILNRIVPLAPDLAVRIRPDFSAKELRRDLSFPAFRCRTITPKHGAVRTINMAIVQCAEELVFFRDQSDWVPAFLGKNRAFRLDTETTQIPVDRGFMNISTMRVKPFQAA